MSQQMVTTRSTDADNLFAGNTMPVVKDAIILKSGSAYLRGMVLALDADGLAVQVDSTAEDSTKIPFGILTDDIDATDGDERAVAYLTGEFNERALIFKGSDTVDGFKTALRKLGIFAKKTSKAQGGM